MTIQAQGPNKNTIPQMKKHKQRIHKLVKSRVGNYNLMKVNLTTGKEKEKSRSRVMATQSAESLQPLEGQFVAPTAQKNLRTLDPFPLNLQGRSDGALANVEVEVEVEVEGESDMVLMMSHTEKRMTSEKSPGMNQKRPKRTKTKMDQRRKEDDEDAVVAAPVALALDEGGEVHPGARKRRKFTVSAESLMIKPLR